MTRYYAGEIVFVPTYRRPGRIVDAIFMGEEGGWFCYNIQMVTGALVHGLLAKEIFPMDLRRSDLDVMTDWVV